MINIRFVGGQDEAAIDAYVADKVWGRADKLWTTLINPLHIGRVLKGFNPNIHAMVVEETYLVLFATVRPWFTDQIIIDEKLIFRLHDGKGKFSDVIDALDAIAKEENAAGIMVGTGLTPNDAAMSRLYKREGFEPSSSNLYKQSLTTERLTP
jgi:hypothetical protein